MREQYEMAQKAISQSLANLRFDGIELDSVYLEQYLQKFDMTLYNHSGEMEEEKPMVLKLTKKEGETNNESNK